MKTSPGPAQQPLPGPATTTISGLAPARGDSAVQREAQVVMIEALSQSIGYRLIPHVPLPHRRMEVDGHCARPPILAEAWAHIGVPKSAQVDKVLGDAFKLAYLADFAVRNGQRRPRLVLVFCDEAACRPFRDAQSWIVDALQHFGIGTEVIDIPTEVRARILEAQRDQDLTVRLEA
jgi:hypothetical protein